jgi:uncharacterized repeat protein (TIGR01451 family)
MKSWLQYLLIGGGSAAAIAAAVYFGAPNLKKPASTPPAAATTSSTSPDFTKTPYKVDSSGNLALDSNGNPVPFTGPVHPGDEIEYVLSYAPPANGSSGPVTITDTLSANQTYVDPSIQAPGWTYPTTPAYAGNTEAYTMAGSGGGGFVLTIPAVSGTTGAPGGGGDGYEPIPVLTSAGVKVFAINHHQPFATYGQTSHIMCWLGASLTPCSSAYPQDSSPGTDRRAIPDFPHAVIYQKKIYFPAGRYDETTYASLELGLGCWDADADTACPFVSLPGTPTLNMGGSSSNANDRYLGFPLDSYLAGLRADPANPTHAYVYASGKIYCVDLAASGMPACSGWVAPTITPTNTPTSSGDRSNTDLYADESGPHLFFSNSVGGVGTVRCFDISNGSTCTGWTANGVSGGSSSGGAMTHATALGPGLDSNGDMKAICISQQFSTPNAWKCFKIADASDITGSPAPSWQQPSTDVIISAYHIPATKKVLFPDYSAGSKCYDFGAGSACSGYAPYWAYEYGTTRDYGYAADPVTPQCLYGLGDGGILVRFKQDGTPATADCVSKPYTATYNINDQFCAQKPHSATWTTLDIDNRPSQLAGGTITIKDGGGTILQTITVTSANSYTLNIPATGASGTVTVEFTPNYGSSAPPTTDYQLKLNYTADVNPQICYKTTVKDCSDASSQGPVTNKAVYTDASGTKDAEVNLGNVVGGHCGPASCLQLTETVVLNADGTATVTITGSGPSGFDSVIVEVHSNTPGVSVAPPSRTFPPGPFTGTWTLSGVTPGESVDLQVDAVDPGAGAKGGDKCCSSAITIVVPPGQDGHQTDVGIQKTGTAEGQGPANGSGYIYTLSVTNYGIPINGQNIIVVTDTVPAGLSFASAGGTDWSCVGPFPLAAGGTMTCTYTGTGMLATGQVLPPITVVSTNAAQGTQLPMVTNCANVGFVFGNGIMDTNLSNNKSCTTNGQTSHAANVVVTKTAVIDGHATTAPGVAFPIAAKCTEPNGAIANLSYIASTHSGFSTPVHSVPLGSRCTVHEPSPPLPPGHRQCHWTTSYAFNGTPVASFPVTIAAAVQPSNVLGVTNVLACETPPPPRCDPTTARASGGACACLYPGMRNSRADPTQCICRAGTVLEPGHGCAIQERTCTETDEHWNGHSCVACPHGGEWDSSQNRCVKKEACDDTSTISRGGSCVCRYQTMTQASPTRCLCPQGSALHPGVGCTPACHDPMIPNAAGTACVCPQGTKPKDGSCVKKGSFLDNIFDNTHVGVGVGGGGSGGHRGGGKPDKPPADNGPVPH